MNPAGAFPRSGAETGRTPPRLAHVIIAIAAFIAGLMLGQLSGDGARGSRIAWPPADAPTRPR